MTYWTWGICRIPSTNDFIDTINKEINNENTIKYYDENGHGLLITETWFVFIDSLYPKFVKIKLLKGEFDYGN